MACDAGLIILRSDMPYPFPLSVLDGTVMGCCLAIFLQNFLIRDTVSSSDVQNLTETGVDEDL